MLCLALPCPSTCTLGFTQVKAILAKEGVRGLYAGYGAFLLRDLPFDAIEFVAYEQLRKAAAKWLGRDPNPVEVSLVGAAAGGFTGDCNVRAACCARRLAVSCHQTLPTLNQTPAVLGLLAPSPAMCSQGALGRAALGLYLEHLTNQLTAATAAAATAAAAAPAAAAPAAATTQAL